MPEANANPRYVKHVQALWSPSDEGSLDGLLEAALAMNALDASPGWKVLRKILVNEIVSIDGAMERTSDTLTHSQLTHLLGRRAAHRELQDAVDAVGVVAQRRLAAQEEKARQAEAQETAERDFDAEVRAADELMARGA
jgi:hypothetical protein